MTIRLNVFDQSGELCQIEAATGGSLMEALREFVAAVCGGTCSCATCHVYIAPNWVERIQPMQGDEHELICELSHKRDTSRLACQIRLSAQLDGLTVTLVPEE